jgi:signal transduction histidine kinase
MSINATTGFRVSILERASCPLAARPTTSISFSARTSQTAARRAGWSSATIAEMRSFRFGSDRTPVPPTGDRADAEKRISRSAKRLDHEFEMSESAAKAEIQASGVHDVPGLVHRLNNPLFAILGHVEFALRDAEPGSATEERMRIIQRTGFEIKDILRGLLESARESTDQAP